MENRPSTWRWRSGFCLAPSCRCWVESAHFIFVLIRFRKRRHPVADHRGVKSGISTHLEFSVVLIEAVLLVGFAIPLWAKRVNEFPATKDAILVNVVAQQFSFNYHLPGP